jgi:hypothetical protein
MSAVIGLVFASAGLLRMFDANGLAEGEELGSNLL